MKSISTVGMKRDDWLAIRMKSLGASEVGTILPREKDSAMGLNDYMTPYEFFEIKTGKEQAPDLSDNPSVRRGILLEPVVADMFVEETGLKVQRDNKIRYGENEILSCSLDRAILNDKEATPGCLEIKTASDYVFKAWEDAVPPMYYAQIQQQLYITGWSYGVFAVLVVGSGFDLHLLRVERDNDWIKNTIPYITEWWKKHIVEGAEPPRAHTDWAKYKSDPKTVAQSTQDIYQTVSEASLLGGQIKNLEKQHDSLKNKLKEFMGEKEVLAWGDEEVLATWKSAKDSTVLDTKRIKKDAPHLYDQWGMPKKGGRKFLIK